MAAYGEAPHGALNSNPMVEVPAPRILYQQQQHQTSVGVTQNGAFPSQNFPRNDLIYNQQARAPVSLAASVGPGRDVSLYSQQKDPNMMLQQAPGPGFRGPQEGVRDGASEGYRTAPTTPEMSGASAPINYGKPPEPQQYGNQDPRNNVPMLPLRSFPAPNVEPHFSPAYDNRPPVVRSNSHQLCGTEFAPGPHNALTRTPIHDTCSTGSPNPGFPQASNRPMVATETQAEQRIIYFYDMHAKYYEFTNFSPDPVTYEGKVYPTSEHLFQAMKFINTRPLLAEHIRTYSNRPRDAFMEARRFQPEWDPAWHSIKIQRMDQVLELKFTSTPELSDMLLNTGDAVLVEDSPVDDFWGCGADRKGKNELGRGLMRLRDKIRAASKHYPGDLIEM